MQYGWSDYWSTLVGLFDNRFVQALMTLLAAMALQLALRTAIAYVVHSAVRGHKYATKTDEKKRERTLIKIFRTANAFVIWVVTPVLVLWELGINVAALLTGAGLVGVVLGLGAQTTIRDFLAGFFIILENQYRVGDVVTLRSGPTEVSGVVEDLTVRITRLRDMEGKVHIITNSTSLIITNQTFGFANVDVDINVGYTEDIAKIEKLINKVGAELARDQDEVWAKNIIEPIKFLRVDGFGEAAVRVKAYGKVTAGMQWDIAGEFRRRLLTVLQHEGIAVALPHITAIQTESIQSKKK